MLKQNEQIRLDLSKFSELYDILFVYDELKDKYSSTMGRNAEDVIRMFKFIILKSKDKMSDRGLIKRTLTDLEYTYFLGYNPEDTTIIDASLLSKFRRERIGNKADSEYENDT